MSNENLKKAVLAAMEEARVAPGASENTEEFVRQTVHAIVDDFESFEAWNLLTRDDIDNWNNNEYEIRELFILRTLAVGA